MSRRRKKRMNRKTKRNYIILLIILVLLLYLMASCFGKVAGSIKSGAEKHSSEEEKKQSQETESVEFTLMCAGDIMAHTPNIRSAATGDGYDFNENYEYVKDYISQADLAMCNMETTFGGGTPTGYPMFNAPDQLADAVKNAGFDLAFTSNNHMMDTGADGVQRTLEILRAAGFETVGSHADGEAAYLVKKVKGVKVGFVSYTYETSEATGGNLSINGTAISEEAGAMINSFCYEELESGDYDRIRADIDGCREAGADLVVCYMHWGNEYQQTPDSRQTSMAQNLADMGADVIFASHPHVTQGADVLGTADGRLVPVFYSMGNFISNQRAETLSNRYTENGTMVYVTVSYDPDEDKCTVESARIIPTWVDKYGSTEYRIIPLDDNLDSNAALAQSGHLSRAQQSRRDAEEMYGVLLEGAGLQEFGSAAAASEEASEEVEEETAA